MELSWLSKVASAPYYYFPTLLSVVLLTQLVIKGYWKLMNAAFEEDYWLAGLFLFVGSSVLVLIFVFLVLILMNLILLFPIK